MTSTRSVLMHIPAHSFTRYLCIAIVLLVAVACGTSETARESPSTSAVSSGVQSESASPAARRSFAQDREAILSMAGQYEVSFDFRETIALQPGYETKEPFEAGARELVRVIEDTGERIVLQHILVLERGTTIVTKHWSQIWTYEDSLRYRYVGNRRWEPERLTADERAGTWTQRVTQVDDSPRYEAVGRWHHQGGTSWWTSENVWRPLPRRERTERSDYDVLISNLRRTLTPDGWVQEFDSRKVVLADTGRTILTREAGLTRFTRVPEQDFSAGTEYWNEMGPFWDDVRGVWEEILSRGEPIQLAAEQDGKRIWERVFAVADSVQNDGEEYLRGSASDRVLGIIDRFRSTDTGSESAEGNVY